MYVIRFNNMLYGTTSRHQYVYVGHFYGNEDLIVPYNILDDALQFESVNEAQKYYNEHKDEYKNFKFLISPCIVKVTFDCKLCLK